MLGFFSARAILNQESKVLAGMQVYNLLIVGLVTYNAITDPESSWWENGFDIITHSLTALSLQSPSDSARLGSIGFNFARLGAIYSGVTSGSTAIPGLLNGVDIFNHLGNLLATIAAKDEEKKAPSETPHVKTM